MKEFRYILKILGKHRKRIVITMACLLGLMFVDLGSPLVVAYLLDDIIAKGKYDMLGVLMAIFAALPFAAGLMRIVNSYMVGVISQRLIFDLRLELYSSIQRLHCEYLHSTMTGKIMERLRGDVTQLQSLLTVQMSQLFVQLSTGLIMIAIMLVMSVRMTFVILLVTLLYVANYKYFVPRIRRLQRRYRRKIDRLSSTAQEKLTGIVVVKSFGLEREESRDFTKRNFAAERVFHRFRMLNVCYSSLACLLTNGTYPILLVYGTYLALRGYMTFGEVTAACAFAVRLLVPAAMLSEFSNQFQQGKVALERIFELINAKPDISNANGLRLADKLTGKVEFQNVAFHYEQGKAVLQGLSLNVKPGWTVALVGQTGCGKSTIINLLYRFYDVCGGRILIDGVDIRDYETQWYRRNIAIVPQEPIILDDTIAANIAYGRNADRIEIQKAAEMAKLSEIVARYPDGLDTKVGNRGVTLSVGEKQRICIARAMLANPAILILDEATSSLDTKSEGLIQSAMNAVMTDRTSFVVAHRLSTIVDADMIVVLDKGKVLEIGRHEQLMAKPNGRYHSLYTTQMSGISATG